MQHVGAKQSAAAVLVLWQVSDKELSVFEIHYVRKPGSSPNDRTRKYESRIPASEPDTLLELNPWDEVGRGVMKIVGPVFAVHGEDSRSGLPVLRRISPRRKID